ncbi:TrkA C-terminal domain-containing protein [Agreia sp. VKM Ac-1783]|uniref:aspartate:alanine exchanger family transporter n=1 Tax=Agreia sp. VKM Ac-1783 TaxID=1938889 RepID=UPI000A2AE344|nr:TrkA C-terminal domain-containing protein [Agreia sp. VKM Ac-1783]SMQ68400.1 putative transport protein [Agreia sp. VKM Ac-1783]
MQGAHDTLVAHPEIVVFATLGLGFLLGRVTVRGIGLGTVTSTLLVGVIFGAVVGGDLQVAPVMRQTFFLLFLFSLGYKLGPQFVSGLRRTGLPQAVFALLMAAVGFATAIGISLVLGFNPGVAAGLASGALTQSAIIGVAQDAISGLPADGATVQAWSDLVPVAYAVTYIFGTLGAALYISLLAPRLLGIRDVAAASRDLESRLGFTEELADVTSAYPKVVRRAYELSRSFASTSVREFEAGVAASAVSGLYVARMRRGGGIIDPGPDDVLSAGDVIVVAGPPAVLIERQLVTTAVERADEELLDFPLEELSIVVTKKNVIGMTVADMRKHPRSRRIFLTRITRGGQPIPVRPDTVLRSGDELRVQGPFELLERVIPLIGQPERTDPKTDIVTIGLGIAVGALIGIPTLVVGDIPLSLTSSVGALLVGLLLGWRRSKRPTFGQIPPGAQWFFETVGLAMFVAIVGIDAGPGFIEGIRDYGAGLLLAGVVVTLVPLIVMTVLGRYMFRKTEPVIILGMLAGALTTTAAVGALREKARSSIPLLGFTIPYAVGNIVLTIGGAVVVAVIAA